MRAGGPPTSGADWAISSSWCGKMLSMPPGVQVEPVAQVAPRHRRALEVPAGVAVAPARRRPAQRASRSGGLPQGEIGGIALVGLDLAAVPGPQLVQGVAGQAAVAVERADGVVDVAELGGIGVAEVLELFRERHHLGDVLGRAREDVGGQDVDQGLVGMERGFVRVGDLGRGLVLEPGLDQHPVLTPVEVVLAQVSDVGDVLDVEHLEPVVQQHAP